VGRLSLALLLHLRHSYACRLRYGPRCSSFSVCCVRTLSSLPYCSTATVSHRHVPLWEGHAADMIDAAAYRHN
jgi:hypothetical protein